MHVCISRTQNVRRCEHCVAPPNCFLYQYYIFCNEVVYKKGWVNVKELRLKQKTENGQYSLFNLLGVEFEDYDPRPNRRGDNMKARRRSNNVFDTGDCVIRTLTKLTDLSYDAVYDVLSREGIRQKRMLNDPYIMGAVCKKYGYTLFRVSLINRISFDTFMSIYKTGRFGLLSNRHALPYVDGVVYDLKNMYWCDTKLIGEPLTGVMAVRTVISDINDRLNYVL